jgi:hypothetical protein
MRRSAAARACDPDCGGEDWLRTGSDTYWIASAGVSFTGVYHVMSTLRSRRQRPPCADSSQDFRLPGGSPAALDHAVPHRGQCSLRDESTGLQIRYAGARDPTFGDDSVAFATVPGSSRRPR